MLSKKILDQILEVASDAIIVVDSEQIIQYFNREAEKMFGYVTHEVLGQNLDILLPKSVRERHHILVKNFSIKKLPPQYMSNRPELFGLKKSGQEFPVEITISSTAVEEQVYSTAIVRDITKRKELELRLQTAVKELEEKNIQLQSINAVKDQFLGMAAHDLRNPVNRIKFSAELLMEQNSSAADAQKLIAMIFKTASSMLDLINDLLNINIIESGKIELKPVPVELKNFIQEICESEMPLAQKKQILVKYEIQEGLPLVKFDPNRIRQVLENLLSNAIKFSNANSQTLVKGYQKDSDIIIEVIDQGQGIRNEELEKLFNPFQQASTRPTAGETGTGLGLAIVKKIIELHQGKIWVESNLGKGSKFSFSLPLN
jgi:PAS domain S-box-containing protein